jgi:hypothetical protein
MAATTRAVFLAMLSTVFSGATRTYCASTLLLRRARPSRPRLFAASATPPTSANGSRLPRATKPGASPLARIPSKNCRASATPSRPLRRASTTPTSRARPRTSSSSAGMMKSRETTHGLVRLSSVDRFAAARARLTRARQSLPTAVLWEVTRVNLMCTSTRTWVGVLTRQPSRAGKSLTTPRPRVTRTPLQRLLATRNSIASTTTTIKPAT